MITQIADSVFPRKTDLEGIIADGCYSTVRGILQQQGVFLSCKKDEFGEHLSRFVFSEDFYRKAFSQFERTHYGVALTGIRFHAADTSILIDELKKQKGITLTSKYSPRLIAVNVPDGNGDISCKIQYDKMNPKFAAYRRRELHEIEAVFRILDGNMVEVCNTPRSNIDSLVIRDVATHIMERQGGQLLNMDIEQFAVADRVDLFDKLIKDDTTREWRIEEVRGLSVRSADVNDAEADLKDSDTQVLHSAVLEGKGLREHPIVKDLIKDRFYFYSTTIWTWSENVNMQIRLRIDFKKKPHVLVVTAETAREFRESEGEGENWDTTTVPKEIGEKCARWFWEQIHAQFNEQMKAIQNRAKSVKRDNADS